MAKMTQSFVLLLALLAGNAAHAQDMTIKHLSIVNGLPSNTIYSIAEDKLGFIWVSTEVGVSRFDGQKFTNFTIEDGLSENEILTLAADSKGRIWFLGFSGTLSYYYNGKFYNSSNDSLLAKVPVVASYEYFFEDRWHGLWFSSTEGYVHIFNNRMEYIAAQQVNTIAGGIVYNTDSGVSFLSSFSKSYSYLPDGSVLSMADSGMVLRNGKMQKLILAHNARKDSVRFGFILLENNDKLWVCTRGQGIFRYSWNNMAAAPDKYLQGKATSCVLKDHEGNMWVSTTGDGLYMLLPWNGAARTYDASNSIISGDVYATTKSDKGVIYAGLNGGTACTIAQDKVERLPLAKLNLTYNRVVKILSKGDDAFFACDNGLIRYNEAAGINTLLSIGVSSDRFTTIAHSIKDMCFYKDGIAAAEGYLVFANATLLKPGNKDHALLPVSERNTRKYAIFKDHNDVVWYATAKGLLSYDGATTKDHPGINNQLSEKIKSIAETADGTLLLATYGRGLIFCKGDTIIKQLTHKTGITHDICKRVVVHKNKIYLATAGGVSCITWEDAAIKSIQLFTTANGLASNDVNDVYADDDEICIATSAGLTILNAKTAHQFSAPPPVYITSIKSGARLLAADSNYTLPYKQNSLHIDFIGISYRSAENIHYRYRLDESQQWQETDNTAVDLSYLAPGAYHFQLCARTLNGAWSKPRSFVFIIKPPFWRTIWFAAICAFTFITTMLLIVRYRVNTANKKRNDALKIKDRIVHLEQQASQAMMNPHFIFNVMNTIQHAINNSDIHKANLYLADFAKLIRMNLDISLKKYISLEEEVAYLDMYLTLESARFGDRLTYQITVADDIDEYETMIPVMLLQPFIENAIWHGILPMKGTGRLTVAIAHADRDTLMVTITDNGIGMQRSKDSKHTDLKTHKSRGMQLTEQRLELLGTIWNRKLTLHISDAYPDAENRGTKVVLTLPSDLS